ncbi:LysR family transcriptional regulator [Noviherbaspirillum aerium]|uniref:LysR family transcriptional regulator n=1 Tax=Noviherbaspirillum aerium TaxID=2588497 RepID=UPI00124E8291|nr:LysR family transcriptional regulator [Noviherbaspirillum aerium]
MNYKQVEAFHTVMLTGSMTIAAQKLFTSQPNISRLMSQLERDTGLRLFERKAGKILATPEAEALFKEVERSFISLQTLDEAALSIRRLGIGELRIGSVSSIAIGLLPKVIRRFRDRFPDVPVSVRISDSPTVSKWTATGYVDFGLVAYTVDTPGVAASICHREKGVCVVPQAHPLAAKKRIRKSDLHGQPFISLPKGDATRAVIDAAFQPDSRNHTLEATFAPAICTMVAAGLGVSIINPLVIRNLQIPSLKAVPFEPAIDFASYLLRPENRVEHSLATAFYACLQDVG